MPLQPANPGQPLHRRHWLLTALLCITVLGVSVVNPAFVTVQNFRDLLIQCAPIAIVACGMTFVIIVGEIDVSVGSLMGLLAALMGILASPAHLGLAVPWVVVITLAAGAGIGLLNGLLITIGRVPSIIATLGMLTILRGITEMLMGGEWITDLPAGLRALGTGAIAGIPISILTAAVITAVCIACARRTHLGLSSYAVGDNATAASLARISTTRIKLTAFAILGLLTGIAALVSVPQQSVIESGIGVGFELIVITAVVVGGTSIRGGVGAITGTLLAALLLGGIRTALVFLKLGETATYWERAIQGAFILAAVLADHWTGVKAWLIGRRGRTGAVAP